MKKEEIEKKSNSTEQELCVVCWNETEYKKDTPIEERVHYVKGVGQLCHKCWQEIFGKNYKG